jgi:hypothetical protein
MEQSSLIWRLTYEGAVNGTILNIFVSGAKEMALF